MNTQYQQQQTNNLSSLAFFKIVNKPLRKVAVYTELIQDRRKNYVFNLIKLLLAALAPTVAP